MATDHNEQLEQKVRDLHKIANDLAERLVSLGHHQDPTVRAWHQHIMRKKI
jgi:DNA-binding ferritin-like protein